MIRSGLGPAELEMGHMSSQEIYSKRISDKTKLRSIYVVCGFKFVQDLHRPMSAVILENQTAFSGPEKTLENNEVKLLGKIAR